MHWEPSQLKRYLLGELSEEVRASLDLKLLSSDEFVSVIEVAEEELIDDYLDGLLTAEEVECFREFFLNSAERIADIELARQLKGYIGEISRSKDTELSSGYLSRPWTFFRANYAILSVSIILLALLGLFYLVLRSSTSDGILSDSEVAQLNQRDLSNLSESANLSRLTLVSEATRDTLQPRTFSLEGLSDPVLLRMALPSGITDEQVRVNISNNGTRIILEKTRVYATEAARDVRILVPRAKLILGTYTVEIAGDSSADVKATYHFQVER